ncbi:MAG TPA: hypothetical protein VKR42_14240 [Ktedonobacteraceae bacterium]|nr:hypothetical protein [Ktedonobacteraceae bacterium]
MSISQEQSVAQAHNPSRKRNELPEHAWYSRAEAMLHWTLDVAVYIGNLSTNIYHCTCLWLISLHSTRGDGER